MEKSSSDRGNNFKRTLARSAYEALLQRLLNNELVPGQILNRRAVAGQLGMSVAPVLEAMFQLESEGLLETIPRKGTQVRPIYPKDVVDMLVVREALECEAARLYCGEPVGNNLVALKRLAVELDRTEPSKPEHWIREIEFHRALVALTGLQMLKEQFRRCIHLFVFYSINRLLSPQEGHDRRHHQWLLDELAIPDPDHAEEVMRAHVRSGTGDLVRTLS